MPGEGRLLARRSLLKLEDAGAKPSAELQHQIRQDASAATKDPASAAESYYVLGQLEEALEHWSHAENNYRRAIRASKGSAEETTRYRIALARLLLQHERMPVSTTPSAPPKEGKEDKKAASTTGLANVLAYIFLALQPPSGDEEPPESAPRIQESISLANELIQAADPKTKGQGYMLLGQAYARQGKRTAGLQLFVKGLELVYPGAVSRDLEKMVQEHPAFLQPDSFARPNAFLAERNFGRGLHAFWAGDYPKAEDYFNVAVGFFKNDARYFYYLGLARLHQPGRLKRDAAIFSIEQGARLEADNHPPSLEVNQSLERVQGGLRRYVDQIRQKAAG
jgi:tetratricopeptide (TPR) repeat protein